MSKSVIMNSFNNNFTFFLNDILQLYPLNADVKNSLKTIELISRFDNVIINTISKRKVYKYSTQKLETLVNIVSLTFASFFTPRTNLCIIVIVLINDFSE